MIAMSGNQIINIVLCMMGIVLAISFHQFHSQKIHRRSCRNEATFKTNGKGFMVKDGSPKLKETMHAPLLPHCARRCLKTSECKSVIYKKRPATQTEKNCQILNVERIDLTYDDILRSTGWVYYEPLQKGTSRCPEGICAPGHRCYENCTSNTHSCVDTSGCHSNPCQNGATCNRFENSYSCTCAHGYNGSSCQTRLCPQGWELKGNYCYHFSQMRATWSVARGICQQQGGDLAIISNSTESAFIKSKISVTYWIGATDQQSEGNFKWVDGTALVYQPWCPNEPSNNDFIEHCLMVMWCGWNDNACSSSLKYVCKKFVRIT